MIYFLDLICFLSCTALTQVEINRFVAQLFDKDQVFTWTASVPKPFYSENPPPAVRVSSFADVFYHHHLINLFCL
jgi:hypothetical protein